MSDFIRFSFRAGVWDGDLHGRADLEEFDFGLAQGTNFYVEHESGATVRPGFEFIDYIQEDDKDVVLYPYRFNKFIANSYAILAGENYIRFIQNGAYVLDAAQPVTAISGNTFTTNAHGYSVGDWVKLAGASSGQNMTYEVTAVTTNTYDLVRVSDNQPAALTYQSGITVSSLHTITSVYAANKLAANNYDQYLNEIVFANREYAQQALSVDENGDWSITPIDFIPDLAAPTGITHTSSAAGSSGAIYTITAIGFDGTESFAGTYRQVADSVNITTEEGQIQLSWDAVTDAQFYRIYRSIFAADASTLNAGQELGYLGKTFATDFTDSNIIPDFKLSPPKYVDPFANGAVRAIKITNPGSGYTSSSTVSVSGGGGSGFSGLPIVNASGELIYIIILAGGSGYSSPTVTVSGGTGAVFDVDLSEASGNYPQAVARWRQRRFFAGSDNFPVSFNASRPGLLRNFGFGTVATASDAIDQELDIAEVTPILHMLAMPTGMFIFTDSSIGQLSGANDKTFSAVDSEFDPISFTGSTELRPLRIDREVLYVEDGHNNVRVLTPSNLPTYYINNTVSSFSSQYFKPTNKIESWTYQHNPHKIIWAQREDGSFLSGTYDAEQKMRAWSDHCTEGCVKWLTSVVEFSENRIYAVVEREGRKYIERMFSKTVVNAEEHYALDAALVSPLTYPSGTLTVTKSGDTLTLVSSEGVFTGAVGQDLRLSNGRAVIAEVTDANNATATIEIEPDYFKLAKGLTHTYANNEWSLTARFNTLTGLDHLEGKTVQIVGNGNRATDQIVTNATLTVPFSASLFIVGRGYDAILEPLPISAVDSVILENRKRVIAAHVLLSNARDFLYGTKGTKFYEFPHRTTEVNGIPLSLTKGYVPMTLGAEWTVDGTIQIKKAGPFGGTILGYVLDVEMGDVED